MEVFQNTVPVHFTDTNPGVFRKFVKCEPVKCKELVLPSSL